MQTNPQVSSAKKSRLDAIDALRVFGTLLVVLFHTLQPFNPLEHWHVENAVKKEIAGYILSILNIWVMPLFMFLAGFSARLALEKRTWRQFTRERWTRLFWPLVLGILLFIPPQVYVERLLRQQFHGSFAAFYPQFFSGIYPVGNFSWHHLWFLAYLFVYSLAGLPVILLLQSRRMPTAPAWLSNPLLLILVPAVPLVFAHWALLDIFPQTNALVGDWAWHAQLFTVFLFGAAFPSNETWRRTLAAWWRIYLSLGIVVTGCSLWFKFAWPFSFSYSGDFAWVLRSVIYRVAEWLWILGLNGVAFERWNKLGAVGAYLAKASLPIYILHQTVIVVLCYFVLDLALSPLPKFLLLVGLVIVVTLTLYEILRRNRFTAFVLGVPPSKPVAVQAVKEPREAMYA